MAGEDRALEPGRGDDRGEVVGELLVYITPLCPRIALPVPAGVVADELVAVPDQRPRAVDHEVAMGGQPVGEDDRRPGPLARPAQDDAVGLDFEFGGAQAAARARSRAAWRSSASSNPRPTRATLR